MVLKFNVANNELTFFLMLVRRLHREIKEVLDDYSQSHDMKCKLLTGRRVTLVEELSEYYTLFEY